MLLIVAAATALVPVRLCPAAEDASAVEQRLGDAVRYLSSDELEGRGVGTKGLDAAADFIATGFRAAGLQTELYDGGPFQKFRMSTGSSLGGKNRLQFVGPPVDGRPAELTLELGRDFNPLTLGASAAFDLPVVLVGYGITAPDEKYDDYSGVDVKGKAVIVLRHEPQQANPHSVFNGREHSPHAPFVRKVANAYEHGAAAVIFCADQFDIDKTVAQWEQRWQTALDDLSEANHKFKEIASPTPEERKAHAAKIARLVESIKSAQDQLGEARNPLLAFDGAGPGGDGRQLPVVYCRRSLIERMVKSSGGVELAELERRIDHDLKPQSQELAGWRAVGEVEVVRKEADVKNVVAVLAGHGPLAEETIVIGAHYDHLGWGGPDSAAPGAHEIHNGADDNASGAAALVEVARQLASLQEKLPRRIVLVAFTGEERGLIGSARYVREPIVPLEKTVAMLNMDMVGRLVDNKLIVYGSGTAKEFDPLVDRLGKEHGFQITKHPEGFGPSDHSSFYAKKIPVLHFFTGTHTDYHRPSDDAEKVNLPGMRRVVAAVVASAVELAQAPSRPSYLETKAPRQGRGGDRPYFGSIPDFAQDQPGYALMGVSKDSPAERAGLKAGDIIVQLGESRIGNLDDFDSALRKFKAGNKVPVTVRRGKEEVKLDVTLDPPR